MLERKTGKDKILSATFSEYSIIQNVFIFEQTAGLYIFVYIIPLQLVCFVFFFIADVFSCWLFFDKVQKEDIVI